MRAFGTTKAHEEVTIAPESYTEKQSKTGRPVSPHVTIYKFPITALSSITNRATGVALTVGLLFLFLFVSSFKSYIFLCTLFR